MPMMWQPARAKKLPTASPNPLEAPRMSAHPDKAGMGTEGGVVMVCKNPTTRSAGSQRLSRRAASSRGAAPSTLSGARADESSDAAHGHESRTNALFFGQLVVRNPGECLAGGRKVGKAT